MATEAEEAMKARGVRVPERYAQMLVPGSWSLYGAAVAGASGLDSKWSA